MKTINLKMKEHYVNVIKYLQEKQRVTIINVGDTDRCMIQIVIRLFTLKEKIIRNQKYQIRAFKSVEFKSTETPIYIHVGL